LGKQERDYYEGCCAGLQRGSMESPGTDALELREEGLSCSASIGKRGDHLSAELPREQKPQAHLKSMVVKDPVGDNQA